MRSLGVGMALELIPSSSDSSSCLV